MSCQLSERIDYARRLERVERLLAAEKIREKIEEEAAIKKSNDIAESNKRRNSNDDQMVINEPKSKISTRKEVAKIAGVGEGTVFRYAYHALFNFLKSDLPTLEFPKVTIWNNSKSCH